MLKPTSSTILSQILSPKEKILNACEPSIFSKSSSKANCIETANTIKVDFNKMSKCKVTSSNYTQCPCGAIMTIEDRNQNFQKKGDLVIWSCRYCQKTNESRELYFSDNNFKTVVEKNIQRGFLPPIIIFVIDQSGSMGQSISVELDTSQKKQENLIIASKEILEIMKNSSFHEKQIHKEEDLKIKYRYEEQKQGFKNTKMQGTQYYSRITFFMAIIQNYLKKFKSQSHCSQFRVGFVFFNDFIYLLKPTKQKMIPTFIPKDQHFSKKFPFEKNIIDFNDFDALFKAGQKYQRFFGDSRIKTADISKMMVQNLDTEGLTALGPALSMALGIVSVHDIGSRIVIVSDQMPNVGILSNQTKLVNEAAFQKILTMIRQKQTSIGVLNWITENNSDLKQLSKNDFEKFLHSDSSFIKQISLDFSLGSKQHVQVLNTARKSLESLINRGSIGSPLSIKIFTSNSKIDVSKFKHDDMDFRFIKFLGLQSKNWIQLKAKKVTEQDYLFPIDTQIVVIYQDVFTKQKYLYMSYIRQKLIGVASQKEAQEYLQLGNSQNLQQLIDLQKIHNFDRDNIVSQYHTSKNMQISSTKMSQQMNPGQISFCDSLNSYAELESRRNADDQDDYL